MMKCVIIDDDDFAINSLKKLINKVKDVQDLEIIKTYINPKDAINELKNISFDLLFVDYEMPGYNGIEIVKNLNPEISVIFVTSHSELSEDIINEVNIKGFLSKPPKKDDLEKILKKINFSPLKPILPSRIKIPNGKKEDLFFNPDDIFYIESDQKYKIIYGINENIKERDLIKRNPIQKNIDISFIRLQKILFPYGFEQISKSHMVNINKISKRKNEEIFFTNGKILHVSDNNKKSFINSIKSLFR